MLSEFTLLRPEWLLAVPVILIAAVMIARGARASDWQRWCEPGVWSVLGERGIRGATWLRWSALAGALLTVLALSGPAVQRAQPLEERLGGQLALVVDLSSSMAAADLTPDRMTRARFFALDLLAALPEDMEVAVVAFAADAFTVSPMTSDRGTVRNLLERLLPAIMPRQGSDVSAALSLATEHVTDLQQGRVLVLTDADWADVPILAADVPVFILPVGTHEGAPVPAGGGQFKREAGGGIAISRTDFAGADRLAADLGGRGLRLEDAPEVVADMLAASAARSVDRARFAQALQWQDLGVYLLPLIVLLLLPWMVRPAAIALVIGGFAMLPQSAVADGWWDNREQVAQRALKAGDNATVLAYSRDTERRAAAHYQAGDFAAAAEQYAQLDTADGHYNRGNALAQLGEIEQAIAAYTQALARDNGHADADYNKTLLEQLQQQQPNSGEPQADQQRQQSADDSQTSQGDANQGEAGDSSAAEQSNESSAAAEQGGEQQSAPSSGQPGGEDTDPADRQPEQVAPREAGGEAEQTAAAATAMGERSDAQGEPMMMPTDGQPVDEQALSDQALLRRLPDDPGGLLRRKFARELAERGRSTEVERDW